MLQDLAAKPPEVELDMPACSRTASNGGRQKGNGNADQALKCPRCDSLNTKFCYYNNYSLSQPRHFCKNCRRYWTRGGALRNVPVGGGCRKNKRAKQRTVDPSTMLANSLPDGSASTSMLPSMNSGSSLLPNLTGGTSGPSFGDLCSDSHILTIAFSRLQDSLRLGEQSGAVSSSPALFCMGDGSRQTSLLNSKCSQPSHMSNMLTYDNDLDNIGYNGSASVKSEQGAVMYNGSDYSPILFEAQTHITGSATATLASLEDQDSTFGIPVESFNGTNFVTRSKLQHQKLALQLMNEVQGGADRSNVQLPAFEDETQDRIIRRHNSKVNGRSMSTDWQQEGMTANLFDPPTGDHHNFWSHSWPDMHALNGSATGAML